MSLQSSGNPNSNSVHSSIYFNLFITVRLPQILRVDKSTNSLIEKIEKNYSGRKHVYIF